MPAKKPATKSLNLAVRRNADRFPEDFMFQLNEEEFKNLRFQIETSSAYGGRRYLPYAFREHGVAMLSSVLRSDRAVQIRILIVRAFVRLRHVLSSNRVLAARIEKLSQTVKDHASLFEMVMQDIKREEAELEHEIYLMKAPRRRKAQIGFVRPGK